MNKLLSVVFWNLFILVLLLISAEFILRLTSREKYQVNRLRLVPSYYEMFTSAPIASDNLNIEVINGITTRRTTPSGSEQDRQMFMFGGSTTMGLNDPFDEENNDGDTIAAHLTELLYADGHPVKVQNFGVGSFRSGDELMKLIKLLKSGERPDYVLFYDGYNDTEFAIRGQAIHDFMRPLRGLLTPYVTVEYCEKMLRQFELYNLLDRLPLFQGWVRAGVYAMLYRAPSEDYQMYSTEGVDQPSLVSVEERVRYCVSNYTETYRMVSALGKEYSFKPIFLLQPMLYFKKQKSNEELIIYEGLPAQLKELTPLFYDEITKAMTGRANFYDIRQAFAEYPETFYIDQGHVEANGNNIIAAYIFNILKSNDVLAL